MDWSSFTKRGASAGSSSSRERAATCWTALTSIGMAQLRERREDFLHARAAEVDRELGALADPFARHHHALSELGMDHAHPDRASLGTAHGCRVLPPPPARDGRSRDPGRALPVEALRRDLAQEARGSSARRVPGAAEVGVEEIHATLGPG